MRNLLICAHDFPPMGGGGVIRMVKFVKYLPQFGWNPIVLTLSADQYVGRPTDPSMLAQLDPAMTVLRTRTMGIGGNAADTPATGDESPPKERTLDSRSSLGRRVIKSLSARFRVRQDRGYLWLPNATKAALEAATDYSIHAVLTTSPPHATQWIGYWLKRRRGIPWVVDFRDGWTDDPLFQSESELRNWAERMQEHMIVNYADHVLCAAPTLRNDLVKKYTRIPSERIEVLYNGFDPEDFASAADEDSATATLTAEDADFTRQRPLRIRYLGSVGGEGRPIGGFLQALRELATEGIGAQELEVVFVGTMPDTDREAAAALPNVTVLGFVPHDEAVRQMRQADVLLAIMGANMGKAVSGKLYEYAAAGKPILLLSGSGASPDLVLSNRWGWICETLDAKAITDILRECLRLHQNRELSQFAPSSASTEKYNRRKTTQRLAEILDRLDKEHVAS